MLISKKYHMELLELAKPIKDHVDHLANCDIDEFISIINAKSKEPWTGLYVDLYHYIPVLNRLDEIFEAHSKHYQLDQEYPKLQQIPNSEEATICACLRYSHWLLEHSNNGRVYSSSDRIFQLVKSCSIDIKLEALKLACLLGEKYSSIESTGSIATDSDKERILTLATSFPPPIIPTYSKPTTIDLSHGKSKKSKKQQKQQTPILHVSLLDCLSVDTALPPRWKFLDFKYYNAQAIKRREQHSQANKPLQSKSSQLQPHSQSQSKSQTQTQSSQLSISSTQSSEPPNQSQQPTEAVLGGRAMKRRARKQILNTQLKSKEEKGGSHHDESSSEGLHHFALNEENLKKLSFQQIYDRALNVIPKEKWYEFVLSVYIAKAFNNKSFESIQLRQKLVSLKCIAVASACHFSTYNAVASSVFDEEPYLLSYMSDLINPDNTVPYEASMAALKAFVSISRKKGGGSDLMRAMGGNVSHGLLFHIFKNILKAAKENRPDLDIRFLEYFFELIANLIKNVHLVGHLRAAGLTGILLEFLTLRNTLRLTRSLSIQLIDMLAETSDNVDDVVEGNGFKILIELLEYEVDFAIENPDFQGGAPKSIELSYSITTMQVDTINSLLQLVISLIANHAGDRMRNLYDSPLLKQLIKIMEHPNVFGTEVVGSTISLIAQIINSEPTAYPILSEAGVIDSFFDNFEGFLLKSKELIHQIPDAINAISLNSIGLKKVADSNMIEQFFQIFRNPVLCKELLKNEHAKMLGDSFDELCRHHPELKPIVQKNVMNVD
ncbi:unnamed protein product [Ambrosiozyma monospora]|uniref:Unnamed protein product n=1 Tax=Ambrosiozyma monospora TaxID=43982 RepID=A0ACB5T0M4_AMBMO|nr:unnamed protein product [Ambrosiozyma monospora]